MSQAGSFTTGGGGGGTVTSISASTGITLTPNPIIGTGTVGLTIPVVVSSGGTGAITLTGLVTGNGASAMTASAITNHYVLVGGASNAVTSVNPSTAGFVLTSNGAADPSFQAISASGAVTSVNAGSNISITGTATAPIVNVAGTTLNQVLLGSGGTGLNGVAVGTNGQILSAVTANPPVWTTSAYPTTNAQGDLIIGSAASTYTNLAKDTNATRYLSNTGTSNNPAWAQVNVANGVTGVLPIANGGTNASSMATTDGTVYFDGTRLVTTATGTSGQVLTSAGAGVAPAYSTLPASSISITGNSGGALTGAAFTFTGGTTGLTFAGAGSTETLGGTLVVANGGTGAATLTGVLIGNGTSAVTASTITQYGTVVAGTSNAVSSIAPSATSGVPYISQGNAANPTFGTAVVAGGGTGATTLTSHGLLYGAGTSAITALAEASNGQIPIGSTGNAPVLATITAGSNITVTNGAGTITIAASGGGGGLTWSVITADQTAAVANGYICNKAGLLTLTLPSSSAIGDIIEVTGMNTALGWKIGQPASTTIHYGTSTTTTGTGGSLASVNIYDAVKIVCNVANTGWIVTSSVGNLTVV